MEISQVFACVLILCILYPCILSQTVRPGCNLNPCRRTNTEICTTNGRLCRRFSNECDWQRENCNAAVATVWHRTDTVECLNIRANATGPCACPALRTCSNRTATTIGTTARGLCGHQGGHRCRLFRSECDMVRASCNRDIWQPLDIMQCREFSFGQTGVCTCPKSQLCSRNQTQLCVQLDADNCRLYSNECDLEADRCRGQRLVDVDNLHCQRFTVGVNGTCTCPGLLTCQQNVTNICVINAANRCQLMPNECDLERLICEGTVLKRTQSVQCRSIRPGESGNCACPDLTTCSVNRTDICVRTRVGCRLKRNECELEQSRCMGEVVTLVSHLQCRGFTSGEGKPCACPRLDTCRRNNTNICVRSSEGCKLIRNECELEQSRCMGEVATLVSNIQCRGFASGEAKPCACPRLETCRPNNTNICVRSSEGCMLMRNECELETARCEGKNFTIVDSVQCTNFTTGQLRSCLCPNMGICNANSPNICVTTLRNQCRLVLNSCELEKARCNGEALSIIEPIQCRGFPVNTTRICSCPRLRNCSERSTNICVRENNNNNVCSLIRNECDLERAICEGRDIKRVAAIHCRNFTINSTNRCYCPKLSTCQRNSSSICVIAATHQCRLVSNECELEQMRCEGKNLVNTQNIQCLNFQIGQERTCSCPNLLACSQNPTRICTRTRRGCKLFSTQCELENAKCRGEILAVVDLIHCQGFSEREEKSCFCPNLQNCSRNATNLCVRNRANTCTLLRNQCDVEQAKCQGQALTIVPSIHCHNFTHQNPSVCSCPNLFNCSRTSTSICARLTTGCKLLRNQCELEQEKCQRNFISTVSIQHCEGFTFGQIRNCSCPNLQTCSRNNTNICVQTGTGCRLMQNECDLERAKCQGQNLRTLPAIQCKSLRPGNAGTCACPNWVNCRQNSAQVCIETSRGCKLLRNQCELEQMRCQGEVFNITSMLQCQGFLAGQLRNCACPELKTCSRSISTRTCVRNQQTCKLMANSCDLALAKCRGETWCTANTEECANFPVGLQQSCSCPGLQTCEQNTRQNICVHWRGACRLMKNQCELEKAKCNGQVWSPTASLQCENYREGEWRWCACPRLLNCCNKPKSFCVKGPRGCKLMRSDCDLQLARCRGEVWTVTDDLQCQHFQLGAAVQMCTCPKLETCQKSPSITSLSSQVCAQNIKGCKLFRNSCEVERSRCIGEEWNLVDQVQCRNFALHHTRSCYCPALEQCSNTTNVCGRVTGNRCYHFRSECDMRRAQCQGQKLVLTQPQMCQGIPFNTSATCACQEQLKCHRNVRVCGRRNDECKLFGSDCDYRQSVCRDNVKTVWQRTDLTNCCQFKINEIKNCTRNLQQAVCGRTSGNRCRLFATRCDLNRVISTTNNEWRLVKRSYCQCLSGGRTGVCNLPFACSPTQVRRNICGHDGRKFHIFESVCHLRRHNYQNCTNFRVVRERLCRRRAG